MYFYETHLHTMPASGAGSIDHIRLYLRSVHGVEIFNGNRSPFENEMAEKYAANYGLLNFSGSDIHGKEPHGERYGMCAENAVVDEQDFVKKVLSGAMQTFHKTLAPFTRG